MRPQKTLSRGACPDRTPPRAAGLQTAPAGWGGAKLNEDRVKQEKIREVKMWYLLVAIVGWILVGVFTSLPVEAGPPIFYVCLTNKTNIPVNYSSRWCHKNGSDCGGFTKTTLAPGYMETHWGPAGKGMLNVDMHEGGPQGQHRLYPLDGTPGGCQNNV